MAHWREIFGRKPVRVAAAAGVVAAAAVALTAAGVSAQGGAPIHVVVDGHAVTLPASPALAGGRVFLPLRDLAALLGMAIPWDPATDTVYIGSAPPAATPATVRLAATSASAAAPASPAADPSAPPAGGSFTYQGLKYTATGLVARPYPGEQTNSGTYWIVSYSITDTSSTPIAVPAAQALVLFGPGGSQIAADGALGGAAPTTINPGITFTSDDVFNVPASASPAAYRLGFIPYQVVGGQYYSAPAESMALPPDAASTVKTAVNDVYDLQDMFTSSKVLTSEQTLTIADVVRTNAVAPDLSAASFNPATSFWIVDFTLANTTSGDISVAASDFALDFGGEDTIAPDDIASLPGFVPPTGLQNPGGVTVPTGATFSGSLLFVLPAGTPTQNPQLQFSADGQTRIGSLTPCAAGACPPVLG